MKLCKHCKEFLTFFSNDVRRDINPTYIKSYKYCKTNFLDNDNKVKSCLEYMNELLGDALKRGWDHEHS